MNNSDAETNVVEDNDADTTAVVNIDADTSAVVNSDDSTGIEGIKKRLDAPNNSPQKFEDFLQYDNLFTNKEDVVPVITNDIPNGIEGIQVRLDKINNIQIPKLLTNVKNLIDKLKDAQAKINVITFEYQKTLAKLNQDADKNQSENTALTTKLNELEKEKKTATTNQTKIIADLEKAVFAVEANLRNANDMTIQGIKPQPQQEQVTQDDLNVIYPIQNNFDTENVEIDNLKNLPSPSNQSQRQTIQDNQQEGMFPTLVSDENKENRDSLAKQILYSNKARISRGGKRKKITKKTKLRNTSKKRNKKTMSKKNKITRKRRN